MASFDWTDQYQTGLPTVDEQHKQLIGLINQYGESLSEGKLQPADLENMLGELARYAGVHFDDEDAVAESEGVDPRHLAAHRDDHATFLQEVARRAAAVSISTGEPDDGDISAAESLHNFLVHWLAFHVLVQDQNLAHQVFSIRGGASAADAYERQQREADGATEPLVVALGGLFRQLSKQNRKLVELNAVLEQRVEERTAALRDANEQLMELALTDVLTGLPNRRHGMGWLKLRWAEGRTTGQAISCLMIDADNFKQINDNYGHDAGDVVLKTLARTLQGAVRTDDLVCRLGGDEFLVICPGTTPEGAVHLAEHVRQTVAALRVPTGTGEWLGSVSIGVGASDGAMRGHDDLVKAADEGVYIAKEDGRNCVRTPNRSG
jgi:hemerythrin